MAWKTFNPGGGLPAPVFPKVITHVASIPQNGQGNIYSPNTPKGVGYKANKTIRPGMDTLTGSASGGSGRGLKFG